MDPINPYWIAVRMNGADRAPHRFERWRHTTPERSLVAHHCPVCAGSLRDDEELCVAPLGPGKALAERRSQKRGQWFDAVGVLCHTECMGDTKVLSIAQKIESAASMIEEAAEEALERVQALALEGSEIDPSSDLVGIASDVTRTAHSMVSWEEQILQPTRGES